jgi:hypothetical protein
MFPSFKEPTMSKVLYVASAVQAALMTQVLIPELTDGFWKNHRPAGHGEVWRDVEVKVTEDGTLGPVGFEAPRNYNLLNLDFSLPNEARLVAVAKSAKENSTFKSVKKELIELGRIVGSRLSTTSAEPLKLYRGNHKPGTVTVSTSKARQASATLTDVATKPVKAPKVAGPKKTVTKVTPSDEGVTTTTTSSGATVRRAPATTAPTTTAANSVFALGGVSVDAED